VSKLYFVLLISFFSLYSYAQNVFSLEEKELLSFRFLSEKRYKEAIEECEKEIKEGNFIDSYINLSASYLALEDYHNAYISCQRGRKVPQQQYNPRLLEIQAISCYNLGRNIEGLNLLQAYLSNSSQERDVSKIYYYIGEIYLRLSQYHHADIALTAALSIRPFEVSWWVRLGYVREKAKSYKYSLEAYEKALSFDKNNSDAIAGKSRVRTFLR